MDPMNYNYNYSLCIACALRKTIGKPLPSEKVLTKLGTGEQEFGKLQKDSVTQSSLTADYLQTVHRQTTHF